jgi:hypothetical protein
VVGRSRGRRRLGRLAGVAVDEHHAARSRAQAAVAPSREHQHWVQRAPEIGEYVLVAGWVVRVALLRLVDDGHTYDGTDEIDAFIRTAASEYTFTRTLIAAAEIAPGEWTLTNRLEGDFPGGTVDLRYRFRLDGDRIARLDIAP